jgi:NADPH-dependent 2,4-dienoyl-CoA reductase/sulfur reductase-like enzyme/nitrite reductase/ring-hydroxylating ferredoxin subunit
MASQQLVRGPDLSLGVALSEIPDGATLAGRVGDDPILVSRRGADFFAVSGACTHYGGHLADGLIEGDHAHCPLHHACFSLRTGEALVAPAFDPLPRWRVDIEGDRLFVRVKLEAQQNASPSGASHHPGRIVIVGGGAAGFAAAEMLRRRGFAGDLTLLSDDAAAPCDRPNLSKDYLAGTAPEEWIPLKSEDFYRDRSIALRLDTQVRSIDVQRREIVGGEERLPYDVLLLATGASPARPSGPGFDQPNAHVLRSLADARSIIAAAEGARTVAILGASFIGLETAASLRARGLEVHVIAPEPVPLQRVLGPEVGAFIRRLHEAHDVHFHLGLTAEKYVGRQLRLSDGTSLYADFVVLGVGVRPNVQLAEAAGLMVNNSVVVDRHMRTSDRAIFAAGDIARYPDAATQQLIRVEHWVAAEQQGQAAAIAMLGDDDAHLPAPFFWSMHYDQAIRYVGHASEWDRVEIDGSLDANDFTARYMLQDRLMAAASLGRDRESLAIQNTMDKRAREAAAR